ncbi:MAG: chromosomal replication initiator protein DnaA [Lentisphaerae bacterium]|nr:chromosomal replication initiator protein DnaA [Lentisphaerota bacterium]
MNSDKPQCSGDENGTYKSSRQPGLVAGVFRNFLRAAFLKRECRRGFSALRFCKDLEYKMLKSGTFRAQEVWNLAVCALKTQSDALYRQWFSKMTAVDIEDDLLIVGVPNDFFMDMVRDQYSDLIQNALNDINGKAYRFELRSGYLPPEQPEPEKKQTAPAKAKAAPASAVPGNAPAAEGANRRNQLYTFDNFICGNCNRHAFAMARSAAEAPGECYNPLFIYGTNGIGKTHLLQAIAGKISAERPDLTIRSVTCYEMLNDYYDMLTRHGNTAEFRAGMKDVDVLLIDDIHLLEKKTALQEEFFNIFNLLYNSGKQIVLTCDRQPCELERIDKRLTSRFEQGMICQVGMPEYEQRVVILRMWRQSHITSVSLSDELLDFLAENITSSVRRLKGCFLRLSAYAEMSGTDDISISQAEELLHAQLTAESQARDIRPEAIQQLVANHFGITLNDMLGKCRSRQIADPRMVAMYLCRKLTRLSSNEVGELFGRTHANVLHAEKCIPEKCESDALLRRSINQLERQLQKH